MWRADRFLALVCSLVLVVGCRDSMEPSAHRAGRPIADIAPGAPNDPVLFYSTYLGGSDYDLGYGIAVDAAGNAYITGETYSTNFPITAGAFQTVSRGSLNAFVTKFNPTGSGLFYSTYLGGSGDDHGQSIVVDATGNAYVGGNTTSIDFPTTPGAFQTWSGGAYDAFVTKLNPSGAALVYSTYLGGSDNDFGAQGIAVDAAGSAYVTGGTRSSDFPTTPGAFQTVLRGVQDAFVTKLNATGSALVYSTFLGGTECCFHQQGLGIAVDAAGNAYVTGPTTATDFPTTLGAFQTTSGGDKDAFATKLNPLGTGLVYSTYLGGSGEDVGQGIALDALPIPNAYVAGLTGSTNFPTTPGAFQTAFGGGPFDAFGAKIANIVLPPGATSGKVTGGGTINVSGGIANFGFIVQASLATGLISGDLQYVNHASGANVHSVTFTTLVIGVNTAIFGGTCTKNGVPCTFTVDGTDNGEPGPNDTFTITGDAGPPESGPLLSRGNIQIHKTP